MDVSTKKNWPDRIFKSSTMIAALIIGAVILAIFVSLIFTANPSIMKFGPGFVTGTNWDPVAEEFGALPFIFGTVVSSIIALIIAVPLSLGIAVFLTELAPQWLRDPITYGIELLAAIPSIIYGAWGLFVLAPLLQSYLEPWLQEHAGFIPLFSGMPLGVGMLLAGIILGIMIIPTIASLSREVIMTVPAAQKEAAYGLGLTRWETISKVILPYARSGILGAMILGFGRAMGETMAVTMVIGNSPTISASLFDPAATIASAIANEFTEATGAMYVSSLIELGLILLVITFIFIAAAKLLIWSIAGNGGRGRE